MTERTALFLASLSHQWALPVMVLPAIFGLAMRRLAGLRARFHREGKPTRGLDLGRAVAGVLFMGSMAVLGVAFLHVGCAALVAHQSECLSHVKQLAGSISMYTQDFDERLPPSPRWAEIVTPWMQGAASSAGRSSEDLFRCPASDSPAAYGVNAALGGCSLSQVAAPADTVLLFEADAPVRSFAGGVQDLAWRRHGGAPNIGFLDGHARYANAFVQKKLLWTAGDAMPRP
jgi:prepilin-type processing-associated H-X9-DG protein